jgi:hypothetical protein
MSRKKKKRKSRKMLNPQTIPTEYWKQSAADSLERYRRKAERYGLVLATDDMLQCFESISAIIVWERIYYMVLDAMDGIEELARRYEFEPMGSEQHYGDLEYKKILDQCVCAQCWTELTARKIQDGWELYCINCGTDCGFHSKWFAEREKHRDTRYADVARNRLEGLMEVRD